ncbi:methionyl-tRNA formyltransferase [Gillisia marina]|uniref:methionyl-tRNA formyltransferase n=1 Tax=Gillisia marina TaxID=1167637 RepID=UPI00029B3664|nr:methionyl-tRNA formyltransferase [Gillisia marina]
MRIGVLASGNLGYSVFKDLIKKNEVVFVMTDKKSFDIINFCKDYNFPNFVGNPRNGKSNEFLIEKKIDVLISINYLYLIEENLIKLPKKLAFNIHGSLLPKYRGRTPHVWSIINNDKETGITAHVIDKGCDTGDIIEQISVPINYNDTGAMILEKYNKLYVPLIDSVLEKIKNDSISLVPQENNKSSYFGKRSPEDGKIDWNWQKERIRNWVRAQSNPYPGAFSFYKSQQFIIDEIEYSDFAFDYEMTNGLILSHSPLLIKTPNGVVEIIKIRDNKPSFEVEQILK